IEIDHGYAPAYYNRGAAFEGRRNLDHAVADYAKAAELDPKNFCYVRALGLARYRNGDFKGAAADLLRARSLADDFSTMLFRYLARTRAGDAAAAADLVENAGKLEMVDRPDEGEDKWRYAITALYLGKASAEDAFQHVSGGCGRLFYVGEWYILQGR